MRWSVQVTKVADWFVLHNAQVVHCTAEGQLDGLADAGRATFHQFDLVDGLVHAQRDHLGSRKPLPGGCIQTESQWQKTAKCVW